jgi:hypothetical protein
MGIVAVCIRNAITTDIGEGEANIRVDTPGIQ